MIVGIHQPHFLPWMGYFNKALRSEVFVWLHSVQYRKNYYQNRTRIKNPQNEQPFWLTLPVHANHDTRIDQVTIADPKSRERIHKTVEQFYHKAPCFAQCWPPIAEAMWKATDNLDDINYRTFLAMLRLMDAGSLNIVRVGELPATSDDPTLRLVEICRSLKATRYIAGKGGHNYLRVEEFDKAGIGVIWQTFDSARVLYPQRGNTFLPGLSVVDSLFNVGPAQTRELALAAWKL
jgi:hypothetical protein